MMKLALTLTLGLALILIWSGCAKNSASTASGPVTFTQIYAESLSTSITCESCHSPGGQGSVAGATLDFSTQSLAYSTLSKAVVNGTSGKPKCGGIPIVTANDPTKSYIAALFVDSYRTANFAGTAGCTPINTHSSSSGNAMAMTTAQQADLISWIQNGALNN